MSIKELYSINNKNNKKGDCGGRGGARFDPKPCHVGEKDKKEKEKYKKKLCSARDLNLRPSGYKSCTLPDRLKLQSAMTPVKFYGFFSKVNLVIYSSSPIS